MKNISRIQKVRLNNEYIRIEDENGNYCDILVERETSFNVASELSVYQKPVPSVYEIFREYIEDNDKIKEIIISSKENDEYKCTLTLETGGSIDMKITDILMMFNVKRDEIMIDKSLLTIVTPEEEDLESKLQAAVEKQDFKEAERIQNLIDARNKSKETDKMH